MAIGMATTLRDARLQAVIDTIDAGAGAGEIRLYDGIRPATGGTVTNLIGTCVLSDPCATISSGVLTFNPISDDVSADATGTITWARIVDSNGVFVMDLGCGIAASGEEIIFNTVSAQLGGVITILSGTLTEGNL